MKLPKRVKYYQFVSTDPAGKTALGVESDHLEETTNSLVETVVGTAGLNFQFDANHS